MVTGYCGNATGATVGDCNNRSVTSGPFTSTLTGVGDISLVPEPASIALVGLGLLAAAAARRRSV